MAKDQTETLRALQPGNVVAILNKKGGLSRFVYVDGVTVIGILAHGNLYDFAGQSTFGDTILRPATELESIIHEIKNVSAQAWMKLPLSELKALAKKLGIGADR